MASVRASLMTQARVAAQHMEAHVTNATATTPAVEQLVRCAQLSEDAARTLEWALHTLRAHGTDRADTAACQLLRAARARLEAAAPASTGHDTRTSGPQSLAWH
jgi:hypothetical protein